MLFSPLLVSLVRLPLRNLPGEALSLQCVFKLRHGFRQQLRRSDLSSILAGRNYVRIDRNVTELSKRAIARL